MSQIQSTVPTKSTTDLFSAAECNDIVSTLNSNATDAEGRLVVVEKSVDHVVDVITKADLPTPSAGAITLLPNVQYRIHDTINLGSDYINLNGGLVEGINSALAVLVYTGTGAAIRSTGNTVILKDFVVLCTGGGDFISAVGTAAHSVLMEQIVCTQCANLGTLDTFQFIGISRSNFSNASVSGLSFLGTSEFTSIRNSVMQDNLGATIDLTGYTCPVMNLTTISFRIPSGAIGIDNVAGTTNIANHFRMHACDFEGLGTNVYAGARCDPPVSFRDNIGNSGTEDSTPSGVVYVADGDESSTTITTVSTLTDIVATTWTFEKDCKFTMDASGVVTYTGDMAITAKVFYKMRIDPASGTNKQYETFIYVNPIAGGAAADLPSRDSVQADNGNPQKIVGFTEIVVHKGDTFKLQIQNITDNTNVTCSAITMTVTG